MNLPNSNFTMKIEELRQLISNPEKPAFWPEDLSAFASWANEEKGFTSFTRPVLYANANAALLEEAKNLMKVAKERWKPNKKNHQNQIRTLETLNKILTSRYCQERQMRLDAEQQASAHKSAVESLRSEIQRLTQPKSLTLVKK